MGDPLPVTPTHPRAESAAESAAEPPQPQSKLEWADASAHLASLTLHITPTSRLNLDDLLMSLHPSLTHLDVRCESKFAPLRDVQCKVKQ